MAQTHRYKRFWPTGCPFSRILGDSSLCVPTGRGSKMVQNRSKMTFSKNDTRPFGVSLEVFLAHYEEPLSCFDLRRVVMFHNVHFQHCMPFKRRPMGSNGVVPKREEHSPFSSVLIPRPHWSPPLPIHGAWVGWVGSLGWVVCQANPKRAKGHAWHVGIHFA